MFAAGCALAAFFAAGAAAPKNGQMEKTLTIVALGDSITAGNPGFLSPSEDPPDGSGDERSQYAYWLMRLHPEWRVLNRGISGQRSDEVLARFDDDVLANRPDVLIVLAGVNDLYQGAGVQGIIRNLEAIYARAAEAGITVVACAVMPYTGSSAAVRMRMAELNAWIERRSVSGSLGFCDLHRLADDPERPGRLLHTDDGIHPDIEGYRLMGEALAAVIEGLLRRAPRRE